MLHPHSTQRTTSGITQSPNRPQDGIRRGRSGCGPAVLRPKWMQSRTTTGAPMTDRGAVANLTSAVVANIEAAQAVEKPFFHLVFERVFPDDVYAAMVEIGRAHV